MSRIKDLKEKYPALSLSIADLLEMIDPTEQNKYLPMLGKIVNKSVEDRWGGEEAYKEEVNRLLGINSYTKDKSGFYSYVLYQFLDMMGGVHNLNTFKKFVELNERGVVENKDIQQYKTWEDLQAAISLVELKEMDKEMATQVVKIFEDDTWLVVRPLTFESSCKYGAGTKWCTTATSEPNHFYRYWNRGALVYILNKQTGYKIATQKYYDENDRSTLWNAADREINWDDADVPSYIFDVVRKELLSKTTNRELCTPEIKDRVEEVCLGRKKHLYVGSIDVAAMEGEMIIANQPQVQRLDTALLNALRVDMDTAVHNEMAETEQLIEESEQPTYVDATDNIQEEMRINFEQALNELLARRVR